PHADVCEAGHRLELRISGLPQDRSGDRIERRPRAAGDRLTSDIQLAVVRELVGNVVVVGDGHVNALAVEGRAPFDTALISAGTDQRAPDGRPGPRVEQRVDAALRADTDDVAEFRPIPILVVVGSAPLESHYVGAGATEIPLLAVGVWSAPRDHSRLGRA